MRKSLVILISSLAVSALITGCASKQAAPGAPSADSVDLEAAKKLRMPIVIYRLGVKKDENGMSRPVIYFVNASPKPVSVVTFHVAGHTKDGRTLMLWADDYEKVPPGKPSKNGMLGGGWKNAEITCVELKEADIHVGGKSLRFLPENINQLFQDVSLNRCQ